MYKYVLFDLDGTLTDPGIGITNSVAYALKKFGIEVSDRRELFRFIGPPLRNSFQRYYGFTYEQSDDAIRYFREYFQSRGIYENTIYAGIVELLRSLKAEGKVLVLATSKPQEFAEQILRHFGIFDYFDYIAGAEMDETRTEKTDVIAYALELCSAPNLSEVIMVGDREYDIVGAFENGINAIGVLFGYGNEEELRNAGAVKLAATPDEIFQLCIQ